MLEAKTTILKKESCIPGTNAQLVLIYVYSECPAICTNLISKSQDLIKTPRKFDKWEISFS